MGSSDCSARESHGRSQLSSKKGVIQPLSEVGGPQVGARQNLLVVSTPSGPLYPKRWPWRQLGGFIPPAPAASQLETVKGGWT